jgi:hypothetical protein
MRASDSDRERVVELLQQHTAAGRLSLDEFAERVDVACAARTLGELAVVTSDLPAQAAAPGDETADGSEPAGHRELLWVFLVAVIALVLFAVAFAASRG